jgi:hypothetical protein
MKKLCISLFCLVSIGNSTYTMDPNNDNKKVDVATQPPASPLSVAPTSSASSTATTPTTATTTTTTTTTVTAPLLSTNPPSSSTSSSTSSTSTAKVKSIPESKKLSRALSTGTPRVRTNLADIQTHSSFSAKVEEQKAQYLSMQYKTAIDNYHEKEVYEQVEFDHKFDKIEREKAAWEAENAKKKEWGIGSVLAPIATKVLIETPLNILNNAGGQLLYKVTYTKMANSEKFKYWVLTQHEIEMEKLDEEGKRIGNKANEAQARNLDIQTFISSQNHDAGRPERRLKDLQTSVGVRNAITNTIRDLDKEKNELVNKKKDKNGSTEFDAEIDEYEADIKVLKRAMRDKSKTIINQVNQDVLASQLEYPKIEVTPPTQEFRIHGA